MRTDLVTSFIMGFAAFLILIGVGSLVGAESTSFENQVDYRYKEKVDSKVTREQNLETQTTLQHDGDVKARYQKKQESETSKTLSGDVLTIQKRKETSKTVELNNDGTVKTETSREAQVGRESSLVTE